jgi:hypothetical protein
VVLSELLDIKGTLKLFNTALVKITFLVDSVLLESLLAAAFEGLKAVLEAENSAAVGAEILMLFTDTVSIIVNTGGDLEETLVHVDVEDTEGEENDNNTKESLDDIKESSSSGEPVKDRVDLPVVLLHVVSHG